MKTTVVPAQVTTVEDKVAGSLSLQQLIMLTSPIFLGSVVYVLFPPFFKAEPYKIVIITVVFAVFATLAIRIKGRLLIQWIGVLLRYNQRPRFHIYDKNDTYLRNKYDETPTAKVTKQPPNKVTSPVITATVPIHDKARLEQIVTDPRAKLTFQTNKKGGLNVHIQEIK
ncbi:hypothetical protein A2707_05470 [Candidatus Saccharibacteria bacterium RIFCSPHIGHO2_01_FULL_45_15]|nr:MAG: hypothetical protein A2707_05470 [Candidatus Saccharibacteria bacterium RIFCSPHIGHO2_01_FULL_45_15]OGL28895.1 MAG: hypothetical protein A3C39_05680 [Candidatus Saccharibacteria bacterium RIFCSPHIGHO2_02_FULL_46_12]OGL31907.1 MAG: hypothetical protein A3E76_01410 [Candidatus Saccharibacteria bacterium RIFCSPHIGHO2_12_FULL_44_22]